MLWIWKLLNLDNDNPVRSVITSRMIHFMHETESVIPRCMISPLMKDILYCSQLWPYL